MYCIIRRIIHLYRALGSECTMVVPLRDGGSVLCVALKARLPLDWGSPPGSPHRGVGLSRMGGKS